MTFYLAALTVMTAAAPGIAQTDFAVASIKPSAAEVKFEHDGKTEVSPGILRMQDVTASRCIQWAYDIQSSQISGPAWLDSDHFDILAKADGPVDKAALKLMMRTLLADRFHLAFHQEEKQKNAYALTIAKGGHKLRDATPGVEPFRQNSATGTIARSITVQEFADFIAGPLQTPVKDETGLTGKYDFNLDLTAYIPAEHVRMDAAAILVPALPAVLGLKLESRKLTVDIYVVDRVEKPAAN